MADSNPPTLRDRLIGATIDLVRQNGFDATRVDDICAAVGASKGAFFHHFASKEAIAAEAARCWLDGANGLFQAKLAGIDDPVARIMAYLDLRIDLLEGPQVQYMCYAGTLLSEVWQSNEKLARHAANSMTGHIDWLTPQIDEALGEGQLGLARQLSTLIQSNVQGALLIAKADGNADRARDCLRHLKSYVQIQLMKGTE